MQCTGRPAPAMASQLPLGHAEAAPLTGVRLEEALPLALARLRCRAIRRAARHTRDAVMDLGGSAPALGAAPLRRAAMCIGRRRALARHDGAPAVDRAPRGIRAIGVARGRALSGARRAQARSRAPLRRAAIGVAVRHTIAPLLRALAPIVAIRRGPAIRGGCRDAALLGAERTIAALLAREGPPAACVAEHTLVAAVARVVPVRARAFAAAYLAPLAVCVRGRGASPVDRLASTARRASLRAVTRVARAAVVVDLRAPADLLAHRARRTPSGGGRAPPVLGAARAGLLAPHGHLTMRVLRRLTYAVLGRAMAVPARHNAALAVGACARRGVLGGDPAGAVAQRAPPLIAAYPRTLAIGRRPRLAAVPVECAQAEHPAQALIAWLAPACARLAPVRARRAEWPRGLGGGRRAGLPLLDTRRRRAAPDDRREQE